MTLLLVYLGIALTMSFLCSLVEATILSITASHVKIVGKTKPRLGRDLQKFKSNIDKPLAAILTLNTFAHTIGAAGVGAQAQLLWGDSSLTVVSLVLTILILILTEIIPKTLGALYWKQLTPFTVRTVKLLIALLYPLVLFSQLITKKLNRNSEANILSREDFSVMAEIGSKDGALKEEEFRIINNIMRFNLTKVSLVMTPRTVVVAVAQNQTIRELYDDTDNLRFSRIPLYEESLDNITGYVLKDEVLQNIIEGNGDKELSTIVRKIIVKPETATTSIVFQKLLREKEHIALIVDEYGGTSGIATMEDLIETVLGLEITDESDNIEDLQQWARDKWTNKSAKK